jgi:hypothetical protein
VPGADLDGKLRENQGRRLWPDFKDALAIAIGGDVADDRLSLGETALLRDAFVARLRSGRDVFRLEERPSLDDVLGPLDDVRKRAGDLPVLLLHHLDRSVGAVRISLRAILASPQQVLALLNGDLYLTSEGAEDGLALQTTTRHVSKSVDRREYSLALWGRFGAQ